MTIPTLVTRYQKMVTVTRLKQTYSMLQSAVNLSVNDNYNVDTWIVNSNARTYESGKEFANKYIIPYLKVSATGEASDYTIKYMNNATIDFTVYYKIYLVNGVILSTFVYDKTPYFWFFIDVNGEKKPNVVGKDIFLFVLHPSHHNNLFSHGDHIKDKEELLSEDDSYNCHNAGIGQRCAWLIMLDNWQIKEDYPW